MAPDIGRFGNYVLEDRLAVGGMAEIFCARREGAAGFARRVCIKRILPTFSGERDFVAMFIDEARTGSQLRHGNIVAIEDFGELEGQYFIAMEYVAGTDLARLLSRVRAAGERFPIDAAGFAVGEVLKALGYAHGRRGEDGRSLQVVHRDISPGNVLLSHTGEVKLTDFGIARAATRLHQTTGQVIKGKLAYMAPEQARGQALDGRADLFAVGVSLYELLAGRRPFVGATEADAVAALLRGQRPALRELRPEVTPALETVVDTLLARDANARYASAGDALGDLARAVNMSAGSRALRTLLTRFAPAEPVNEVGSAATDPAGSASDAATTDPSDPPRFSADSIARGAAHARTDVAPGPLGHGPSTDVDPVTPAAVSQRSAPAPSAPERETAADAVTRTMVANRGQEATAGAAVAASESAPVRTARGVPWPLVTVLLVALGMAVAAVYLLR